MDIIESKTLTRVTTITPEELKRELDFKQDLFMLDVRNMDEFSQWKIEGKNRVEILHIPYFEFIENLEMSIGKVPKDRDITVVCAKGGSSEYVAEMLRERGVPARSLEGGMIAWGNFHQAVAVSVAKEEQPDISFYQINRFGKGCLSYLIGLEGEAIVVDPSRHIDEYIKLAKENDLKIKYVFDTHLHADHISGGRLLAERMGTRYYIQSADADGARYSYEPIRDGQEFAVGRIRVRVIALQTPGHTPGSTTLLVNEKFLLTGDTLFVKSVGRPDLGGMAEPWARSLYHTLFNKLGELPDDVWILPAHFSTQDEVEADGLVTARLGDLRKNNPAIRIRREEEFVKFILANIPKQPAIYDEIRKANLGLVEVDKDRVLEMELGKNQCAAGSGAKPDTSKRKTTFSELLNQPKVLDVQGAKCPIPIIRAKQEMEKLRPGEVVKIVATDPGSIADFQGWARVNKIIKLVKQEKEGDETGKTLYVHYIQKVEPEDGVMAGAAVQVTGPAGFMHDGQLEKRLSGLEQRLSKIESELPDNRVSLVVFSGDLDKVLAAFVVATGAAALGMDVSMFFTFWGLNALKRKNEYRNKSLSEKLMSLMTPAGTTELGVSKMNFFGIGAKILRSMMKEKQVASLEELLEQARNLDVKIIACQMSMDVMGIKREELIGGIEVGGAATFLSDAIKSKVSLFI